MDGEAHLAHFLELFAWFTGYRYCSLHTTVSKARKSILAMRLHGTYGGWKGIINNVQRITVLSLLLASTNTIDLNAFTLILGCNRSFRFCHIPSSQNALTFAFTSCKR